MKNFFSLLGCLIIVVVVASGCQEKSTPPQEQQQPEAVRSELDRLNDWPTEELDVLECRDDHPERIASGETGGWVFSARERLQKLGVVVRWNCEKKVYEIGPTGVTKPVCGCSK
ncbi:MAG TPA: hypothetical protein VMP08_07040 [Anaerolineae bacterium]|nr:hypothetical protein [Anaerolineae bacterium]